MQSFGGTTRSVVLWVVVGSTLAAVNTAHSRSKPKAKAAPAKTTAVKKAQPVGSQPASPVPPDSKPAVPAGPTTAAVPPSASATSQASATTATAQAVTPPPAAAPAPPPAAASAPTTTAALGSTPLPRPAPGSVLVSTLLKSGGSGYQDGPGDTAQFDRIEGAALIGSTLYLSDGNGNDLIRQIDMKTGMVSTLAGKRLQSDSINGSLAESRFAQLGPMVAVGNTLYVVQLATEHGGSCIRSVDLSAQRTATLTGDCKRKGNLDGSKETALFSSPRAIATDGQNLYVAEAARIRSVAIDTGAVTTLAGEADAQCDFGLQRICKGGWVDAVGNEARFEGIRSIALSGRNLYIADGDAIRVLELGGRKVSTVIGSRKSQHAGDDGIGSSAGLTSVRAIAPVEGGLLVLQGPYFAGLRYLNLASNSLVSLTGISMPGFARGSSDVDGPAAKANFVNPRHLVQSGSRTLIVQENGRIRSFEKF